MLRPVFAAHRSLPSNSKRMRLRPRVVADLRQDDDTGRWLVTGPKPRLALIPECAYQARGWVLLRGKLHRRGTDFTSLLFAEFAGSPGQWNEYPVPVSLKGTVLQLLHFQETVSRFEFQPMAGSGSFELEDFCIQKVNHAGLFVRRVQRVRHIFATKPRARREKIGLHWYTPFVGLGKSYELANRLRGYYPTLTYSQWLNEVEALTRDDRRQIAGHVKRWMVRPRFWVVVFAGVADVDRLQITLGSLQAQIYFNTLVLVIAPSDEVATLRAQITAAGWLTIQSLEGDREAAATGRRTLVAAQDWLMTVAPGALFPEHALYWFASVALRDAECRLLYSDHDFIDADGRRADPEFKPDWSPELLRSSNYIGAAVAVRSDLAAAVSAVPFADVQMAMATAVADQGLHAFLLRASERLSAKEVHHVPAVLLHLPRQDTLPADSERSLGSVEDHLFRLSLGARVSLSAHGYCRVRYLLPAAPSMVTIVVPTRDGLTHLRACVESVLTMSTYRNFELVVVDNQSAQAETLEYLAVMQAHPQVRVLRYPQPFNYAAINNYAATVARGEALCLLNDDTEVITPDWLEEMLGHLMQPDVGVVGAKLYFGDGRVQHAGDTVGPGGCAHHLHSFLERDAPGYCGRAVQAQDLSAVTGACLLTWRSLYEELGGLDEVNLPVAFNDVDYCLRVREAKRRVVWTPYAELYHHESVSRSKDESPEKAAQAVREVQFMRKRWEHVLDHDPFYNPNLSYERPDFSLSVAPLIARPWLE